jgi:predicted negative regulator of RcsB-dependent stress response
MKGKTENFLLWFGRTFVAIVLGGILTFLGTFFFTEWPNLKAQVTVMDAGQRMFKEDIAEIKADVKEVKSGQENLMRFLVKRHRKDDN